MVSIAYALRRIKNDLATVLEPSVIEQAAREIGHVWRDRRLGPAATIHLFFLEKGRKRREKEGHSTFWRGERGTFYFLNRSTPKCEGEPPPP